MKICLSLISFIIVLVGCQQSIGNKSKRNEHWAWFEDESGKGKWIPVGEGDHTNVSNGKITFFYFNGNISEVVKIKDDRLTDTTFRYDINGVLEGYIFEGSIRRFYFLHNGSYKRFFHDGKLYAEGVIANHHAGDIWTEYYQNSNKAYYYNLNQNKGVYCNWLENGSLKYKQEGEFKHLYNLHDLQLINGSMLQYYESGAKKDSINVVDGEIEGVGYNWYENGLVRTIVNSKHGIAEGEIKGFHENGKLKFVANMKNGQLNGIYKKYDTSGKYKDEFMVKDGAVIN